MRGEMGQHIKYFHLRDVCLWMVERINIPIPLPKAIVKIKHSFHQGRGDLFDAARDVFLPELGGDIYARHLLLQVKDYILCAPEVTSEKYTSWGTQTNAYNWFSGVQIKF